MMTAPQDYYCCYYRYYTLELSALFGTLENNQLIAPLDRAKVFEHLSLSSSQLPGTF